ncbi:MAG: EamA family transporter, partial [Clostridia bacterium]|nr:EamA family transporter [Clostridia bacterium]
ENGILLTVSLVAALGGSIFKKLYTNRDSRLSGSFAYTAVGCLVAAADLFAWGGFGKASLFTLLLGVLFGAVTALQGVTNMAALQVGPLSYTTVIISFSTLISALSGVLFFGESIGLWQIIGMALMLASFALANGGENGGKRANLRWLLLCVVAFLATGAIGVMQKIHQSSAFKGELNAFLVIAFAVSAFLSGVITLLLRKKDRTSNAPENARGKMILLIFLMLISGVCVAVNNKLNLYLSGVIDSVIFFPVVNGGGLVLTTLASLLIFKERLRAKQWIGILLGIASVLCLCVG